MDKWGSADTNRKHRATRYLVTDGNSGLERIPGMRDGRSVDVLDFVRRVLSASNDVEVLVGSDSHNRANHTIYSTAVVPALPQERRPGDLPA